MQFVLLDRSGKPLQDSEGRLILLPSREKAAQWTMPGERVEVYKPGRHDPQLTPD